MYRFACKITKLFRRHSHRPQHWGGRTPKTPPSVLWRHTSIVFFSLGAPAYFTEVDLLEFVTLTETEILTMRM